MMGALYMGNKVLLKPDMRTSFPVEQFIRLLHYCGMPKEDVNLLHANGEVTEAILKKTPMRQT
jgi:1-pyrroline-5-carboxylate dehydrogenase